MSIAISTSENGTARTRVRRLVAGATVLATVFGGAALTMSMFGGDADAENLVHLSGRVEGDEAAVAAKVGGRIREISVREGDKVTAGQVIAVLDDAQVRAREEDARFAVSQAQAQVLRAQRQIAVLEAELERSRLGTGQARTDSDGRVAQAMAQEAAAEAELAREEALWRQARADADRLSKLAEMGVLSVREAEEARSNAAAHEAAVRAARKQVDAAKGSVEAARATLTNPAINEAGTLAIIRQLDQARADIVAAEAEANRAHARLKEAEANRADLRVVAPFDGTVITRAAEPGEVVTAGTPIVTIVDLSTVYLRGFVPEGEIGRVRIGQEARVYLDSAPDTPIAAVVDRVDPEASFTPENTYFRDDRVKQVVGVKLRILSSEGFAKPGMPAEGEIVVGES
jgi:HlyD family secretion protein